jgi:Zn-dependent peptidase ImmA (M78 family)
MCRKLWGLDEFTPIDIFRVVLEKVENVSIVFFYTEENLSGSSIKTGNQNIIFINSRHPLGRQRFTLAHEIYHLKYDQDFVNCDIDHGNDEVEAQADQFASYLLMSNGALFNYEMDNDIKEWNLDKIIQAEQYFQISHKAMLRRLKELGKISEYEAEDLLPDITYNAQLRGYDTKLYKPFSEDKNLILGNYIQMVNKAYENNRISDSKKEELLIDGFYDNLVYKVETDDLIER